VQQRRRADDIDGVADQRRDVLRPAAYQCARADSIEAVDGLGERVGRYARCLDEGEANIAGLRFELGCQERDGRAATGADLDDVRLGIGNPS
jgi:hypothetical protein